MVHHRHMPYKIAHCVSEKQASKEDSRSILPSSATQRINSPMPPTSPYRWKKNPHTPPPLPLNIRRRVTARKTSQINHATLLRHIPIFTPHRLVPTPLITSPPDVPVIDLHAHTAPDGMAPTVYTWLAPQSGGPICTITHPATCSAYWWRRSRTWTSHL